MTKRVLMTTDTIGGVWTYSLQLAHALSECGIEVVLATMGDRPRSEQRETALRIPGVTLHESTYRLEWMDHPWGDVRKAGQWLLALEARTAPSLIHLNGYAHAALPWCAPVLVAAHSCMLGWFKAVLGETPPPHFAAYKEAVSRGLVAADVVVAPTRVMLDTLREHYVPGLPGRVIPNGLTSDRLRPAPKQPFILSASRLWDPAKNVIALDTVAERLPWPIFVAGSNERPTGQVVKHASVTSLGWLDSESLAGWLEQALIYALPARYEPFGLSALEAGLCGCALVLGDIPSLREVWGDAAVFVKPDDPAMLDRTFRELINDEPLLLAMGNRARRRALRFSRARMAKAYLDLYLELLAPTRVKGTTRCA